MRTEKTAMLNSGLSVQTLTQKEVQRAQLYYLLFVVCVILFRKQRT